MQQIKLINKTNIDDVYKIAQECLGSEAWSRKAFLDEFKNDYSYTFVCLYNDKIVGFLNAHFIFDECNLNSIAVTKDYRNKGAGNSLINALTKLAYEKSINFITLEVRKSNENAIMFYQKKGFSLIGERKNFYSMPLENALIFKKQLGKEI